MTTKSPQPPNQLPRFLRVAFQAIVRSPFYLRRILRKSALKKAYLQGQADFTRDHFVEEPDKAIVETGDKLREQLLHDTRQKYAESHYRVLLLNPGTVTGDIWFGGLTSCLSHAGIECYLLPTQTTPSSLNERLEEFRPNVFIAVDTTSVLRSMDLRFLQEFKRKHGCLRLFIPEVRVGSSRMRSLDLNWRRSLWDSGLMADAQFSIFEPEFTERFRVDKFNSEVECITVAQACNPFTERPLPEPKVYDYFMATSMTDERLDVTYRYLRSILKHYHGLWAGPRWGFGLDQVPIDAMATRYSQARIALSPIVRFVSRYSAELTHRVFAAAGCGAFQLTMPTAITRRYFEPDELVQADSPAQFERLFDHFIKRPDERSDVAMRALQRVYRSHTCFHRIDKLVAHLDYWRSRGLF